MDQRKLAAPEDGRTPERKRIRRRCSLLEILELGLKFVKGEAFGGDALLGVGEDQPGHRFGVGNPLRLVGFGGGAADGRGARPKAWAA